MADITLAQYFKFDETDLQANRTGHFTEKQKARLAANDKSNRTWSLIGGIVLALIALGGLGSAVAAVIGSHEYVLYYVDSADKNASSPAFVKNLDSIQSVEELHVATNTPEQAKAETRQRGNLLRIDCGPKKIETIKVIRQLTGLGLADAKVIAETPHAVVIKDVDATTAREAIVSFTNAGARVGIE